MWNLAPTRTRIQNPQILAQKTYLEPMSNPTDPEDSALSEPMVARLEIEQLGDATSEKKITDAVKALNGVRDVKVEKDALFVTYDPLITTEKSCSF